VWHERFWTKLARYAGAGSTGKTTRRIVSSVGSQYAAGTYGEFEAQFFGKDLLPLPKDVQPKPKVVLRPPVGVTLEKQEFEMSPKATGGGDWEGRFTARVLLKAPGEYGLDIKLGGNDEPSSSHKIKVIETDAETENTRPDLAAAYELATEADAVLDRIEDSAKKTALRQALQRYRSASLAEKSAGEKPATAAADKEKLRLVFDLRSAALIPDCMKTVVNKQESRGKVDDIWDMGLPLGDVLYWSAIGMAVLTGLLGLLALAFFAGGRRPIGTIVGAGMVGLLALSAYVGYAYLRASPQVTFSVVLGAIVILLSIEWLTRKLLRLA
jgi:hypothetical protein